MLELLIVLAIMVGIAALTFPRLTRPLAESDAHQAANRLRDAITECRRSAALGGEPLFMRLESHQSQVEWGGWSVLLAGEFEGGEFAGGEQNWQPEADRERSAADDRNEALPGDPTTLHSAPLPAGVMIESVRWIHTASAGDAVAVDASEADSGAGTRAVSEPSAEQPPVASDEATAVLEGERWYLPFLPSGRTRNCMIVLRDPLSGGRVALELDSVSGMTRVSRLPSSQPAGDS